MWRGRAIWSPPENPCLVPAWLLELGLSVSASEDEELRRMSESLMIYVVQAPQLAFSKSGGGQTKT